jgi:hypothetical protein
MVSGCQFSAGERAELQKELIENWKNGDRREILGVHYVLEFSRELGSWDEVRRRKAQILIKHRFLQEFERNRSHRINELLLASYRQKHGRIENLNRRRQPVKI